MSATGSEQKVNSSEKNAAKKICIALSVACGIIVALLIISRMLGLVHPFYIPSASMNPTVSVGDHALAEGFTFLQRKPRRGDIVVFKSDGIPVLSPSWYHKRIVGEPGEHLELADGKLFINGAVVIITNQNKVISYPLPEQFAAAASYTNVIIPPDNYFVIGDNSTNSFDSRFWGFLPANNIKTRIWFCYWPPARIGFVK